MKSITHVLQSVVTRIIEAGVDPKYIRNSAIATDFYTMLPGGTSVKSLYAISVV